MKSQFLSPDQIHDNQWRDLQKIVTFAYHHNRFYRQRFNDAHFEPGDLKTFSDFEQLPVLTKDDLRNNLDELISDGLTREKLHWRRTGGSTGIPVQVYWDDYSHMFKPAMVYRHDSWAGFLPAARKAALWGDTSKKLSLKGKLYHALFIRTIYLDTLDMDEDHILDFIERIRRFKPRLLFGHGHSIYFFASFLSNHSIDDIRFDGIISSAETLPPSERKVVEDVFGKIVFDRYGCEEVALIASECEAHDGLHIGAEGIYVEVLGGDDKKPGPVILTDLVNKGTPLIRYDVGDLATIRKGNCACGRGLPRLGRVFGRTSDILYTPEGKVISGISILDTFTIHIPGFKQVQIVQGELDRLTFNIVKADDFSDESLRLLGESIPRYFGPSMKYDVVFHDKIPMTSRGKFQFSICKLSKSKLP
jgi:phenylacetate-CoA ligase